jgi:stage V sporulation protein B
LLPAVSENLDERNRPRLQQCVGNAVKYSVIIGLFSTAVFFCFGQDIGTAVYHNSCAGDYIRILSPLCPLLYLSTTLNSVINGLGKPHLSFFTTVAGLLVRLAIIVFVVPKTGIYGVLIGLLVSQLISTVFDAILVLKYCKVFPPVSQWLVLPALFAFAPAQLFVSLYRFLQKETPFSSIPLLLATFGLYCVSYVALLWFGHIIRKEDWRE